MNKAITIIAVISVLAAMHQQFVEILRTIALERFKADKATLDKLTIGVGGIALTAILAIATDADLFALMKDPDGFLKSYPRFFMSAYPGMNQTSMVAAFGCVAMAFVVTPGASFWHDVMKGFLAMRAAVAVVPATVADAASGEPSPSPEIPSPSSSTGPDVGVMTPQSGIAGVPGGRHAATDVPHLTPEMIGAAPELAVLALPHTTVTSG